MMRKDIIKGSIKINKRYFILTILLVSIIGSVGLISYIYSILGDEFALDRSTDIMGRPKYIHPIGDRGKGQLSGPLSVAVFGKYVYIADSLHGKLAIFTKRGAHVTSIKITGKTKVYPIGIAIDDQRRIYLTIESQGSYRIIVVDSDGHFQYVFPANPGTNDGNVPILNRPTGLFYQDDKLYVTDAGDHDIKIFTTDGRLLKKFGRPGYKPGEFMFPHGITADENGEIFVADSNNSRVQVFDKNGRFKYLFKPNPKEPLLLPRGIAIDSLGRVHVVDLARQKVFVFTKEGKFLLSYGSGRGIEEPLSYP
ncbi:MAG: 6-bladed beta-propeller, partial [Actinomycetota bacterium]|nr:6-bladed beta-propeller [Actinomycetota bacterium]